MEDAKAVIISIAILLIFLAIGYLFAKSVKDYEVIAPENGVHCVVVSRMYNTSVDCWKTE